MTKRVLNEWLVSNAHRFNHSEITVLAAIINLAPADDVKVIATDSFALAEETGWSVKTIRAVIKRLRLKTNWLFDYGNGSKTIKVTPQI